MTIQRARLRVSLCVLLVALWAMAGDVCAQTVLGIATDAGQVNHYPGPDGQVGTADDVVSGNLTSVQASAPNSGGSYGFNAFKFAPSGPNDSAIPTGYDAITFVKGAVTINKTVFANGGGAIVTALDITSGTEPFPGHGAYTSSIAAVNGGTYNTANHQFTLNVDFQYLIAGNVGMEPGLDLAGNAIYQASADFGTDTGDAYFENVVKPLAMAKGASGAVYIAGTGQLTQLGYPIKFTVVALEGTGIPINAGLNDAWVSDGAPYQGVFFTVFDDLNLLFMAWFTFDTVAPANDDAILGASDQRWVTGVGKYTGDTVTIAAELTTGGKFNASNPVATQDTSYGTITVEFKGCNEAVLTYNLPGPGLSGQITLHRVVNSNVPHCVALAYP